MPSLGSRPHDPLAARGRLHLVDRTVGQRARAARSQDRRDEGISAEDAAVRAPRPGRGQATGNIWYTGNQEALRRQARSEDGHRHRIPHARPRGARSPHADLRPEGNAVVHAAVRPTWSETRSADRRGEGSSTTPTARSYPVRHGQWIPRAFPCSSMFGGNKVGQPRSGDDGDQGIHAAESGDAAAAHCDHARRRDLVFGLFPRLSGPVRSEDRRSQGVAVSRAGRSPSPTASRPSNGIIWYSESAVRPNTLVRFDPRTEKFQTWVIPSGGGVVRNMMATTDGNLVLACSGVNRVALVDVR